MQAKHLGCTHDEPVDPEIDFMEATELHAYTRRSAKTKYEPEPHFVPVEDLEKEVADREKIRAKQSALMEEDSKHFTYPISHVTEEEMQRRKDLKEKEDEVRHHAWE